MTAAMPVAPISAAPRPPAAASTHSAPSNATPAPRKFLHALGLVCLCSESGAVDLLVDSIYKCGVCLLNLHM